jgi:hypothetical protein
MANPHDQVPQPPFPKQRQEWPGTESEMQPKPDFGESSYRGHDRLKGKAAIITGGDSGIGRAVALAYAREGADVLISSKRALGCGTNDWPGPGKRTSRDRGCRRHK